jgi:hypothetical protein
VNSTCTARFWQLLNALPEDVRELAQKNYLLWRDNSRHPSLRFKCLEGVIWSIRIGDHYRALAEVREQQVTWIWIGHHAEYDQILRRR